jgi:hypothetical protein
MCEAWGVGVCLIMGQSVTVSRGNTVVCAGVGSSKSGLVFTGFFLCSFSEPVSLLLWLHHLDAPKGKKGHVLLNCQSADRFSECFVPMSGPNWKDGTLTGQDVWRGLLTQQTPLCVSWGSLPSPTPSEFFWGHSQ